MSSALHLIRLMKASARKRQKPSSSIFPVFVQVRSRSNCSSIFAFGDERLAGVDAAFGAVAGLESPLLVTGSGLRLVTPCGEASGGVRFAAMGMVTGNAPPTGGVSPHAWKIP